jgi:hypothetical protein
MRLLNLNIATLIASAALAAPSAVRAQSASAAAPTLTFSGEVRQRSDWDGPTGASADLISYLRTRLGVRGAPRRGLSLFVQLQDSRVYGAESNTTSTAPDQLELHQAYAQLEGATGTDTLTLRAGRQEIALGNERLVGASNWTNTGRSFDGLLFSVRGRSTTAHLFVATMDERGRRVGAPGVAGTRNDHETLGGYATRRLGGSALLDGTLLYDVGGQYRTFDRAHRATADVRLRSNGPTATRVELEGAYQIGHQRFLPTLGAPVAQRVSAWLFGARLESPQRAMTPFDATLGVDVLSGDASPSDGTYGAFNTMYATNHPFYGLLDLFADPAARTDDRGLVDGFAQANWRAAPKYGLHAELHRFAATERPASGAPGPLGWEADLNLPYALAPGVTLEGGYSVFRAATGAAGLTLGAPGQAHHWAYLQLRAGF